MRRRGFITHGSAGDPRRPRRRRRQGAGPSRPPHSRAPEAPALPQSLCARHAAVCADICADAHMAEWGARRDLRDETAIPGFARRLEAQSPPCREGSVPRSRLVARPSSEAVTPWATQACRGGWHQRGSNPGPRGPAAYILYAHAAPPSAQTAPRPCRRQASDAAEGEKEGEGGDKRRL